MRFSSERAEDEEETGVVEDEDEADDKADEEAVEGEEEADEESGAVSRARLAGRLVLAVATTGADDAEASATIGF